MLLEDLTLPSDFQDFFSRVADRVNSGQILADLPAWICRNTTIGGRPWSFKDHEFQKDIAKDVSPKKVVKKCSQVGLTELQIRLALAYCRVSKGRSLMYVLPYTKLAQKIAQSRVDPVIEGSPSLKSSLRTGANSTMYKQIGSSHFYMGGADKVTEAISTPLTRILTDERDFCRERILGIYKSRMRHTEEGEAMDDEFSTPTVSGFGITAAYERSDQKRYMCKCLHCGHQQAPDFEKQIVIPGMTKKFRDLEKEDFLYHVYNFEASYIRCAKCGKELDSSLAVADQREWVAKYPGRAISGYSVMPFDLYKYNKTPKIVMQYPDYMQQDYWNFVLGKELDTSENKVNNEVVKECFVNQPVDEADETCIGIDVGKFVHVFIGKKDNKRQVIQKFKLRFGDGSMFEQVCEIIDKFNAVKICIDAGPDISLPTDLLNKYGPQMVFPCYYTSGKKVQLTFFEYNEDTGNTNIARTKAFDHMVKALNNRGYEFMRCNEAEKKEILDHFQQMARKDELNDEGERVARWVKLSDQDHWLHSLMYLHVAMEISGDHVKVPTGVNPFGVSGVSIGKSSVIDTSSDIEKTLRSYGFGTRRRQ